MRKVRKSKPPEQAIEQYTFYGTVVYTCPYCSAQLGGGAETSRRPETCPECGQRIAYEEAQ
jgi:DNA-directed RNA polymerase subunit RPC12/RpoP